MLNNYKLSKAGISVRDALERFNNDSDTYEELLYSFVDNKNFEALYTAIKNRNIEEAFYNAHSLKGLTGNLGMKNLYNHLEPLVECLRTKSFENTEILLEKVESDYKIIMQVLGERK